MTGKKRQGVPTVVRPRVENPLISDKKIYPPKAAVPLTPDVETHPTTERTTTMNPFKTAIAAIKENKTVLARKALIAVGAAAGMLITSSLVDKMGKPHVEVYIVPDDTTTDDTETTIDLENPQF